MMENEEMEVLLAESEGDGWVKARNYKGEEGFVPQNYLDLNPEDIPSTNVVTAAEDFDAANEPQQEWNQEQAEAQNEANSSHPLHPEISFSSVDYTYEPSFEEAELGLPEQEAVQVEEAGKHIILTVRVLFSFSTVVNFFLQQWLFLRGT